MMSSGKFPAPADARAFRRSFVDLWSAFVRDTFPSTTVAAATFGVDESTARSWWHGITAPSGYVVAMAFSRFPAQAAAALLGASGGWRVMRLGGAI